MNDAQVRATAEQVRGKAMAHEVGIDIRFDAGAGGVLFDELADAGSGELFSPDREENLGAGFFGDKFGAFALDVGADGLTSGLAEGYEAGLFALACDSNERGVEVDIFEARVAKFGNAEPAGVEQLEDRPVAQAERIIRADTLDELPHLLDMQGLGKMLLWARQRERLGGILGPCAAGDQKAEKNPHGHSIDPHRGSLESGALAGDEKVGDLLGLDPPPLARLRVLFQPSGKGLQRALHEQLVALGKPALGGQIHQKFLDILWHDWSQCPALVASRQAGFEGVSVDISFFIEALEVF